MKIQCDVCGKDEASVFCCADEAALCVVCDRSVHRANKLAGKHRRLPLHLPSSAVDHPLCDICQEKRGYVFCREDRAILCKDCDAPIHEASELTMKHSRFLLTGVRLSATPIIPEPPPVVGSIAGNNESSSISEYLIKTLPGWRVEDILIDDAAVAAAAGIIRKPDQSLPSIEVGLDFPVWESHVPQIHHPTDVFMVPQISPAMGDNKRQRPSSFYYY